MKVEDITLDWLQARVIERDGHWIWAGHIGGKGKVPQVRVDKVLHSVNRLIWEISHDRKVPKGMRVGPSCGNDGCVHPDCLISRKPAVLLKGRKMPIATRIRIAKSKRANSSLTQEDVQRMRVDERSADVVAAELGVHMSYVCRIRAGGARRDLNNPFAGLGA